MREPFPLVTNNHLKIDPEFLNAVPPVTEEEYLDLKNSIQNHGINLEALRCTSDGTVVDGHTRLQICEELGIEAYAVCSSPAAGDPDWTRADFLMQAIELNATRRQLSPAQLTELRHKMAIAGASAKEIVATTGCHLATAKRAKAAAGTQDTTRSDQTKEGLLNAHGANAPSPHMGTQVDLEDAIAAQNWPESAEDIAEAKAAMAHAETQAQAERASNDPAVRATRSAIFTLSGGPSPRAEIPLFLDHLANEDPIYYLDNIKGAQAFLVELTTKLLERYDDV